MRLVGLSLIRGGLLAGIAFLLFLWSLGTPFMAAWRNAWIAACVTEAGGPYYCFDCDPHGCGSWFNTWFGSLPVLGILALLIGGALLFGVGTAHARRRMMAEKES